MSWDGIWRPQEPPMTGVQVTQIQDTALRHFSSYAVPLKVQRNGIYDPATVAFVAEYQQRKNTSGYRPILPANPSAEFGDCDYATKVALGLIPSAIVQPPVSTPQMVAYSVPGTGGIWNDGPPWWVCQRLDGRRIYSQGVDYNTSAFLVPDPNHSYVEARQEGVAEMMRLALPDPRPKIPIGYSMGADVVTRFLYEWPAERRGEIKAVIKFGDPGHLPGFGKVGQDSVNGGISRVFTPDWVVDRTSSYQIDGDMYGDAPGLLPFFYDVLTRMEISGEFVGYLFTLLTGIPTDITGLIGGLGGLSGGLGGLGGGLGGGVFGPQPASMPNQLGSQLLGLGTSGIGIPGFGGMSGLLGLITPGPLNVLTGPVSLASMLMNIPAIIQTLMAALKFLYTSAHGKYGGSESLPIFNGVDAVIDAANSVNRLAVR